MSAPDREPARMATVPSSVAIVRGIYHCRRGEWHSGLHYLIKVGGAQPTGDDAFPGHYYSYLGHALARCERRHAEALDLCEHAVALGFFEPENFLNLAWVRPPATGRGQRDGAQPRSHRPRPRTGCPVASTRTRVRWLWKGRAFEVPIRSLMPTRTHVPAASLTFRSASGGIVFPGAMIAVHGLMLVLLVKDFIPASGVRDLEEALELGLIGLTAVVGGLFAFFNFPVAITIGSSNITLRYLGGSEATFERRDVSWRAFGSFGILKGRLRSAGLRGAFAIITPLFSERARLLELVARWDVPTGAP